MKLKKKYVNLIKLIIFILIIIFVIMFIVNLLKKEHNIKYKIDNYNVMEKFYLNNKNHYYNIVISDSKTKYIYSYNNNLNKSKMIVKKIITKTSNKTICIMPIYKNKNNSNVLCNYKDNIVSLYYLKNTDNKTYNKIIKMYKKDGYDISIKENNNIKKYKKISIYKDNIDDNEIYTLWNYKGLYLINDNPSYKKILNEDKYENDLALLVDNYYIFVDTNNKYNGFKLYYYDILKDKLKTFEKTKYKIDDDIYFCGSYNNLLYIYDKHHKKQYTFNPKKEKLKKVGDKVKGFYLVKNNKLELVDYYEFKDIIYFNNNINDKKISKLYDSNSIYLYNNNYYIYSNDGLFYKVDMNNLKDKVILFKLENISNYILRDNNIIISSGGNLFRYDEIDGLKQIISYNELNYNYKNIFDYYEKN